MRVLLIEDEQRLAENIATALREVGVAVDHAEDGEDGYQCGQQGVYDAIVLDLMLPGKSGQSILQDLRKRKIHTPVLILTALEGKDSIVQLLNNGADDYLKQALRPGRAAGTNQGLDTPGQGCVVPHPHSS